MSLRIGGTTPDAGRPGLMINKIVLTFPAGWILRSRQDRKRSFGRSRCRNQTRV